MNDMNSDSRKPGDRLKDMADDLQEKLAPAVKKVRDAVDPAVDKVKDAVVPAVDKVRDAVDPAVDKVKEKAGPVIDKVKDGVSDAFDAVKESAGRLGDMLDGDDSAPEIKNEFFDELGKEVQAQRDAARAKAEEMQRRLEDMLGGHDPK